MNRKDLTKTIIDTLIRNFAILLIVMAAVALYVHLSTTFVSWS